MSAPPTTTTDHGASSGAGDGTVVSMPDRGRPQDTAASEIVFEGVSKFYGEVLGVNRVSLRIPPGINALVGPNGSGKTTLMNLMTGLIHPDRGTITVRGRSPRAPENLMSITGYATQYDSAPRGSTGLDFVRTGLLLAGHTSAEAEERAWKALEQVDLTDAAQRKIAGYSKGMRQRLGMAQALLGAPELLLLDEPTSGLDPVLRRDLYTVVESCRDAGATVLISTHALAEIEGRTDRIAVLSNGRLVAVGTLEELRRETGLPVAIHVTTVKGRAGALANDLHDAQLQKVNESSVSLSCSESEKLQIVARVSSRPEWVRDVEIIRPGLEDIYACFVGDGRPR